MSQTKQPLELAGFWIRFAAGLVDWILLTVASFFVEWAVLGIFQIHLDPFNYQIANAVLYAVLGIPYYVNFQARLGGTPGKLLFKIRVIDERSLPKLVNPSVRTLWIRYASYVVSYLPFLAGFIMAAFHPQKKAAHDLIAKTLSIRT